MTFCLWRILNKGVLSCGWRSLKVYLMQMISWKKDRESLLYHNCTSRLKELYLSIWRSESEEKGIKQSSIAWTATNSVKDANTIEKWREHLFWFTTTSIGLQDGRMYERATNRVSFVADQVDLAHTLQRLSTTSDPLNEGGLRQNMNHESSTHPKSRSLSEGKDSSPSYEQRKVSFADNCLSKRADKGQRSYPDIDRRLNRHL